MTHMRKKTNERGNLPHPSQETTQNRDNFSYKTARMRSRFRHTKCVRMVSKRIICQSEEEGLETHTYLKYGFNPLQSSVMKTIVHRAHPRGLQCTVMAVHGRFTCGVQIHPWMQLTSPMATDEVCTQNYHLNIRINIFTLRRHACGRLLYCISLLDMF